MSPENILLRLPGPEEEAIRAIYAQLAERGLPEQRQRPHISVTFAPKMDPRVVGEAAALLPGMLPAQLRRAGMVVFGTKSKQTVAWLLEAPEDLERAARHLSAMNPDGRGQRWVPHLTMGLRIPKLLVPEYIAALDEATSPHLRHVTAERAAFYQTGVGAELAL